MFDSRKEIYNELTEQTAERYVGSKMKRKRTRNEETVRLVGRSGGGGGRSVDKNEIRARRRRNTVRALPAHRNGRPTVTVVHVRHCCLECLWVRECTREVRGLVGWTPRSYGQSRGKAAVPAANISPR